MVAYHGAGSLVRRAVESILAQTHTDLRCVVVNDADTQDPPWPYLEGIDDPRLIRFDMPVNRGRYFVDAVVFEALEPEWWALADPDDWSEPRRFEVMLEAQVAGAAFGPWWVHRRSGDVVIKSTHQSCMRQPTRNRFAIAGYGAGLISGERIDDAGGFHPGYRVAYDTFMVSVVKLRGPWGVTGEPLAHKTMRAGSLTTSPETGNRSRYRKRAHAQRAALWSKVWSAHTTGRSVRRVVQRDIPDELHEAVSAEARRLREEVSSLAA